MTLFADEMAWPTAFVLAVMLGGMFSLAAWAIYLGYKEGHR